MSKNDFLMVTFWWFFFLQKPPTNGFKDVSARFRTTLAFFWSSLGIFARQKPCKTIKFGSKTFHNSTNIDSLELKTKWQKQIKKWSKVLQKYLIRHSRPILIGLWATRCLPEVLQAPSVALCALCAGSRCQKMMTFWSGTKKKSGTQKPSRKMFWVWFSMTKLVFDVLWVSKYAKTLVKRCKMNHKGSITPLILRIWS